MGIAFSENSGVENNESEEERRVGWILQGEQASLILQRHTPHTRSQTIPKFK